jgi:hypothetical protein
MRSRGVTLDESTYSASSALIDRLLGYEISRYVFGESAEYARRLKDDAWVAATLKFLHGASTERGLLEKADSAAKAK